MFNRRKFKSNVVLKRIIFSGLKRQAVLHYIFIKNSCVKFKSSQSRYSCIHFDRTHIGTELGPLLLN